MSKTANATLNEKINAALTIGDRRAAAMDANAADYASGRISFAEYVARSIAIHDRFESIAI